MTDIVMLALTDGRRLATRYRPPSQAGRPTLLFLPGYASDMEGTKAQAVDRFAEATGAGCLRLDYSGTGSSDGEFVEGTLERWLGDAIGVVDALTTGPLIVIGSSMGGWLMLHLALQRPDRVGALVGIAAAPDFTDWGYSAEDKAALVRDGKLEQANPYGPDPSVTHADFWRSGETMRLLDAEIAIECPVRLLHGDADEEVPVDVALRTMKALRSVDVQLVLVKGAGHRLSEPPEIDALLRLLAPLVEIRS